MVGCTHSAQNTSSLKRSTTARHVYGTLIGVNRALNSRYLERRSKCRVHITLLDIHAGALARDLVVFLLLNELNRGVTDATVVLEIKAALFYMYIAVIMPDYCHDRWHSVGLLTSYHQIFTCATDYSTLSETPMHVSPNALLDSLHLSMSTRTAYQGCWMRSNTGPPSSLPPA
jgi:hypothetical protein